ncbi:glycosyltransferase family 2 protein [Halarchaeum nitratireducens]|uniref:Glycosyl transferase family 2 n=1 Tax=Halarchaeum nitratireducens TaxID=489913 RepID=A0A830GAC8_9EURY|nr:MULTISPECIES: glycosyltransferase [Halarchaeum]MBP2251568.1 glycosyltransferase involved in cell wall biosynthesis [Halarchaeum solikamskense]GGN14006.1 glycosyl transferase family 2 [Halarchaeum nitratireducens]
MELSVVVPTLNARRRLARALDALDTHLPDVEVVVVNGPSSDGTSGLVRDHPAADVLLEIPERNLNASRNAGLAAATGDVVAFVDHRSVVREGWYDALAAAIEAGADVVTGPVHRAVSGGVTTEECERETVAGRDVRYFDGGNVAFTRAAAEALDGFDEYLETGAARDAAHRLAGLDTRVVWEPAFAVLRADGDDVPDRVAETPEGSATGLKYRALAYRLAKNYGVSLSVAWRAVRHALREAGAAARDVLDGDETPSSWLSRGRAVLTNAVSGVEAGLRARRRDRTPTRNPNGVSSRMDRAMSRYDL